MLDARLCRDRLRLACSWLTDIAQVGPTDVLPQDAASRHRHVTWAGAMRGEYSVARRAWGFFCPVWHTGQAVVALLDAAAVLDDAEALRASARRAGDFILAARVTDGADAGLVLAYEDFPDKANVSAILECVRGLFALGEPAGLDAVRWVTERAVIEGQGLVRDLYDPSTRSFVPHAFGGEGRPLLDDGAFLTAYEMTGEERYRETARSIAERLLADERPDGNWLSYAPCDAVTGALHPRHAYWWGRPMLGMYGLTGDDRYKRMFERSCDWYRRALRRDGGLLRNTYVDFSTDSFGHATSGVACAALMFLDAREILGDETMDPWIERTLSYCMAMQFTAPRDPALRGCILEKVHAPDGTDASPYHVRDLGTIFFVQAMARYLSATTGA